MSSKQQCKTAQRQLLRDISKRFKDGKTFMTRHSRQEISGYQYSYEEETRKERRQDIHQQKMFEKQVDMVENFNQSGRVRAWTTTAQNRQRKNSSQSNVGQKITEAKNREHQKRLLYKKRQVDLDERIKNSQNFPGGQISSMTQGLSKVEEQIVSSTGKRPNRVTNKIQIEELLRLNKQNLATTYMDATLDFANMRGCDHGLILTKFVDDQFLYEQKEMIRKELDLGLKAMLNLKNMPDEHILRYWKGKIQHIKAYIKAYKFDIKIPQQLQFASEHQLMMEEIHAKIADQKEKIALMAKIPSAKSVRISNKRLRTNHSKDSKERNEKKESKSITLQALQLHNQSTSGVENTTNTNIKSNESQEDKVQIPEEAVAVVPTTSKPKPNSGNINSMLRPITAQPLTRLRKATNIAAHKYNWQKNNNQTSIHTNLHKANNLEQTTGTLPFQCSSLKSTFSKDKTATLNFGVATPSLSTLKYSKNLSVSGIPKALISDSNQVRNLCRWPQHGYSRVSSMGEKAGVKSQASSVAQLDAFTRKWLNLDIGNDDHDSAESNIKHPALVDNNEQSVQQQKEHLTPQPELVSPKTGSSKQKATTEADMNKLHVESLDSVLTLLSSIKKDGAIDKENNVILDKGFASNEYFMLLDQSQSAKTNDGFPMLAQQTNTQFALPPTAMPFNVDPSTQHLQNDNINIKKGVVRSQTPGQLKVPKNNQQSNRYYDHDNKGQSHQQINIMELVSPGVKTIFNHSSQSSQDQNQQQQQTSFMTNVSPARLLKQQKEQMLHQEYRVLPLTNMPVNEDIDKPYKSLYKFSQQQQPIQQSIQSLDEVARPPPEAATMAKNNPSLLSLNSVEQRASATAKKQRVLLSHSGQIQIKTNQSLKRREQLMRGIQDRNTSSVDMSAGMHYYNQNVGVKDNRISSIVEKAGSNNKINSNSIKRSSVNTDSMLADPRTVQLSAAKKSQISRHHSAGGQKIPKKSKIIQHQNKHNAVFVQNQLLFDKNSSEKDHFSKPVAGNGFISIETNHVVATGAESSQQESVPPSKTYLTYIQQKDGSDQQSLVTNTGGMLQFVQKNGVNAGNHESQQQQSPKSSGTGVPGQFNDFQPLDVIRGAQQNNYKNNNIFDNKKKTNSSQIIVSLDPKDNWMKDLQHQRPVSSGLKRSSNRINTLTSLDSGAERSFHDSGGKNNNNANNNNFSISSSIRHKKSQDSSIKRRRRLEDPADVPSSQFVIMKSHRKDSVSPPRSKRNSAADAAGIRIYSRSIKLNERQHLSENMSIGGELIQRRESQNTTQNHNIVTVFTGSEDYPRSKRVNSSKKGGGFSTAAMPLQQQRVNFSKLRGKKYHKNTRTSQQKNKFAQEDRSETYRHNDSFMSNREQFDGEFDSRGEESELMGGYTIPIQNDLSFDEDIVVEPPSGQLSKSKSHNIVNDNFSAANQQYIGIVVKDDAQQQPDQQLLINLVSGQPPQIINTESINTQFIAPTKNSSETTNELIQQVLNNESNQNDAGQKQDQPIINIDTSIPMHTDESLVKLYQSKDGFEEDQRGLAVQPSIFTKMMRDEALVKSSPINTTQDQIKKNQIVRSSQQLPKGHNRHDLRLKVTVINFSANKQQKNQYQNLSTNINQATSVNSSSVGYYNHRQRLKSGYKQLRHQKQQMINQQQFSLNTFLNDTVNIQQSIEKQMQEITVQTSTDRTHSTDREKAHRIMQAFTKLEQQSSFVTQQQQNGSASGTISLGLSNKTNKCRVLKKQSKSKHINSRAHNTRSTISSEALQKDMEYMQKGAQFIMVQQQRALYKQQLQQQQESLNQSQNKDQEYSHPKRQTKSSKSGKRYAAATAKTTITKQQHQHNLGDFLFAFKTK